MLLLAFTIFLLNNLSLVFAQSSSELRIDPLLLVSLKECRSIMSNLGKEIFPGWEFQKIPVLFYRPNVEEILINYPHQPKGYTRYTGFNPLGNDTIYVRNDTTLFSIDDQNTSHEIEGIQVLIVADPYSSMRNQLRDILNRPKDFASKWLDDWNFIPSPYDLLTMILHESFHVYQNNMAPDKSANEMVVSQYPVLDPVNNALYVVEGNILYDALLTQDTKLKKEKIKKFVSVRSYRQSRLDSSWVEYENLNEYTEGLAKYVEYKFLKLGESIEPIKEMSYCNGFKGYSGILRPVFQNRMKNMVNIVAVNDDRFGNKFGSGPLRFKLYDLGACQALLLDDIKSNWKENIFDNNVYLTNLLKKAVDLSPSELNRYLELAKSEYKYDEAYTTKLEFEQEGKKKIQEKLASILQTDRTLVKIKYGGFVDKIIYGFTPFGVTQISKRSAIYDMIPMVITFKEGVELKTKQIIPLLIDREAKMIAFAVSTPLTKFDLSTSNKLETDEFILSGAMFESKQEGNTIEIYLK